MAWHKDDQLAEVERRITALVRFEQEPPSESALASRLDVLERVIQLLRLRSGRLENKLPMEELLARWQGQPPAETAMGSAIFVGAERTSHRAREARRHPDLHVALLLFLLHKRTVGSHIGENLNQFILAIGDGLMPADLEATRTGVIRIATTTRDAARALRQHGLLRDSDETRGSRWELSVLGILTAVRLSDSHAKISLPAAVASGEAFSLNGGRKRLASEVEKIIRTFAAPRDVEKSLMALVGEDTDVFASFERVVDVLASHCKSMKEHWRALDERRYIKSQIALREEATRMLRAVEESVQTEPFAEALNKRLSVRRSRVE
jgi:hypothetical protein